MNTCKSCKRSQDGQFGLFCTVAEAALQVDPVGGEKSPIEGREINMGNTTCLDLRLAQFGQCGPGGKLFICEYED